MPTNKELSDYAKAQSSVNAWAGRGPAQPIDVLMGQGFLRAIEAASPSLGQQEIRDYEASPKNSKTVQRFRREMKNIFDTVPLVESKYNKGKTITLRQAVVEDFARQMKPLSAANKHADTILRQFTGDLRDDQIGRQVKMLLGRVAETVEPPAEYGPRPDSFVTLDEMDEFKRQARANPDAPSARYRLNEAGQKHWQQQRYYDFLRSMQDGPNAPPQATASTGLLQAVSVPLGIAAYPFAMGYGNIANLIDPSLNQAPTSEKYLQGQADNLRLARNTWGGGVEGRMDSALYWLDRGKDAKATKDPISGANFPSRSVATTTGFGDQWNNYANLYTRANSLVDIPARNFGMGLDSMAALGAVRSELMRDTPVTPTKEMRDRAVKANDDTRQHQNLQQQWLSANAPRAAYAVNDALGTNIKPSYLSSIAATGLALPQEMMDLQGALGLGKSLFKAATKGGFKTLPSVAKEYAKEVLGEAPAEYTMSIPEELGLAGPEQVQPDAATFLFTAPSRLDALTFKDGDRMVSPLATDRPNYEKGLAEYNQKRSDLTREIENYQQSSSWAKAIRDFQSGKRVPAWRLKHGRPTDKWTPSPIKAP